MEQWRGQASNRAQCDKPGHAFGHCARTRSVSDKHTCCGSDNFGLNAEVLKIALLFGATLRRFAVIEQVGQ